MTKPISGHIVKFAFLLLMVPTAVLGQYFDQHYVAPASWQYWHDATEIVLSTTVDSNVVVDIHKSDGSLLTQLSFNSSQPAVYRPSGKFNNFPRHPLHTVIDGAGMICSGTGPFSVNVRNVASDQLGTDVYIKGNASLTSFGDPGIGTSFRVGYYRDGNLPHRPVYTVMAISDDTRIELDGNELCVLNRGQSYLFPAPIGSLVEAGKPVVMNTGTFLDAPGGCGDGTFDQIPPLAVLGNRYFVVRTRGTGIAEQSTIISSEDQSWIRINRYDASGNFISKDSVFIAKAGGFHTISNGDGQTPLSVAEVSSDDAIVVYSGSAQRCEVDVSTSFPISSPCHGSNRIQTFKFTTYRNGYLPYFAYVLLEDDSAEVLVNGSSLEAIVGPRKRIGDTDLYMIPCSSGQLGNPNVITFSSPVRLQVVIIQIGGGFSMSAAFSNLVEQPVLEDPIYIGSHPCPIRSALLKASSQYSQIQWFLNGMEIPGANDSLFIATEAGTYHIRAFLDCGDEVESAPISVTLDSIPQGQTEKISCGPFVWHDSVYAEPGTYTRIIQNPDGCDSLAILVLDIKEPGSSIQYIETCDEFLWTQNGKSYQQSGLYADTLKGRFDCDSVVFLDLQINSSSYEVVDAVTCEPFYWSQTGEVYLQSGIFTDTMVNTHGCDSILALNLHIHGIVESRESYSACDSFDWHGHVMYNGGLFRDTLTSYLGCDSIVILDLDLHRSHAVFEQERTCDEFYWGVTDEYYDSSGTYEAHFSNRNGCDSTHTLNLVIDESDTKMDTVDVIGQYFWKRTQILYTEPGTYYQSFLNKNGCDSSFVLILRLRKRGRVFIPNVFTPDGDLVNDRFTLFASSEIKEIKKLMIFDRWGELLFEQYEFPPNLEEYGWDGTLNGELVLPAVFTYYATWEDADGELQERVGDVTLMR